MRPRGYGSELRVLAVLAEDLGSVPSTHIRLLTNTCNSSAFNTFYLPPRTSALGAYGAIHTYIKHNIRHINQTNKYF